MRALRIEASNEIGNEPVVSIMVALGIRGSGEEEWGSSVEARRLSETCYSVSWFAGVSIMLRIKQRSAAVKYVTFRMPKHSNSIK